MKKFTYIDRNQCECGETLAGNGRIVKKDTEFGPVIFRQCVNCGTWAQSPQIDTASQRRWYDSLEYQAAEKSNSHTGIYLNYRADEIQRRIEAVARYNRDLVNILPTGSRVLEIGCATGSLLAVLKDKGCHVVGVDLSEEFVRQAKELNNLDVLAIDFIDFEEPEEKFDLIIMLGTVSNLNNLPIQLKRVHSLLRAGGHLYLNLPLADSWVAKLYGTKMWMFTPSICNFFSRKGIQLVLENSGFQVVKYAADKQRPTVSKIFSLAGLKRFYGVAKQLRLSQYTLPIFLPIPGIAAILVRQKES